MGARGPAPKPTELKQLEGTYRADRAARNEPKPRVTVPPCPSWLSAEGKREYRRAAKLLVRLRVLTEADRMALAAYAHEYSKWREAEDIIDMQGMVLTGAKGGMYMNPWRGIANTHFKNMVKLLAEFGMTPASRSRIEAQPPEEEEQSLAEKLFASVTQSER